MRGKQQLRLPHLELLFEMNRLFLSFLQVRVQRDEDCLGLPAGDRAGLLDSGAPMSSSIGRPSLPHALFVL